MSALGHTGSVELKPASGKKRSTNSKDFKNIAGGSGQKALVAYVKELLSMNEATDKELDIKDLEKMIKNPDPKRVKSYGGTKYVDMLKSKIAKLKESFDFEKANVLTYDEYDEVQNFQNFNKKDWKRNAIQRKYIRKKKV